MLSSKSNTVLINQSQKITKGVKVKKMFFRSMSSLVFIFLFSVQSLFNPVWASSVTEQTVWQKAALNLPEPSGIFNKVLRSEIQKSIVLPELETSNQSDQLIKRLQSLDKELFKYVRVSESSTRFEQLNRLMPALVNIEERKLIEQYLTNHGQSVPRLRNDRLYSLLDKRISRLANGLIFNMKPLVRERRDYEPELLQAMANNGIEFSARPPDFILDYQLEPEGQNKQNEWTFKGSIALLNTFEMPIVSVEKELTEPSGIKEQAQIEGVTQLAHLVTNKLKQFLIQTIPP